MTLIEELKRKLDVAGVWDKQELLTRGQFLKIGGSTDSNLYFIEQGSVRIFIETESEEMTIRLGYENNFIAALDSFITNKPSDLSIQALKKCRLLKLSRNNFFQFLKGEERGAELWQQILEMWLVDQMERERDILTSSPHERFDRVMKRSPHVFQHIPLKYIASYLRMTPETLSRLRKP